MAGSILVDGLFKFTLPEPLRAWEEGSAKADLAPHQIGLTLSILPPLYGWLIGSVGLFFRQRWAAWVYTISLITAHLLSAFIGPTVSTGPGAAVEAAGMLCAGLILGLVFFSDALKPDPPITR